MTHPAILKAQELYDEPRDLETHEQTLIADVNRITMECARNKGSAIRAWGLGSIGADAVANLANSQQTERLTLALERYSLAVEAQDEVEEIELAEAAE